MASIIDASTAGVGGIITTADNTGNLNIQSGGSTKIAVTSAGVAVTGTFTVNGTAITSSKVLQVVQSLISGKASTSSTSLTKLATSASITPTSSSSKILVAMYTAIGNDGTTGNANFSILRTVSASDTNITGTLFNKQAQTAAYQLDGVSWSILDEPATTSAVTYSLAGIRADGLATPFCGGRATDSAYAMGVMFILMEIAA